MKKHTYFLTVLTCFKKSHTLPPHKFETCKRSSTTLPPHKFESINGAPPAAATRPRLSSHDEDGGDDLEEETVLSGEEESTEMIGEQEGPVVQTQLFKSRAAAVASITAFHLEEGQHGSGMEGR
jgi:hypothetical protein